MKKSTILIFSIIIVLSAMGIAHADTITLTDFTDGTVEQRTESTSNASVTISGTYSGTPTTIEARVVDDGTSDEVVTWTEIDATPAGDVFSGALTIPEGGWYNVQVRYSNDTGVTDEGSNKMGVGILIALIGQSNANSMINRGQTIAENALFRLFNGTVWSTYDNATTPGDGVRQLTNDIISAEGVPVGVIPYGVSGSALIRGIGAAAGDWTDRASDPYDTFKTRADAASAAFEYVIWMQGEQDAETGATASHDGYEDALRALITAVRADFANGSDQTNLPFIIAQTGRRTSSVNDSDHWEVKSAQLHVADNYADTYMVTTTDATLADAVHYDATFCITLGQRMAQTVNKILGNETYQGRGPKIEGCYLTDLDTIDVKLTHRGGTDITPTSGITGFEVLEDGAAVTVSSVARQDATTVRLTLQSDLTSPDVVVRYQYGADPTVTTPIKDNSGLTLPLELFVLDIDLSNMMYVNLTDGTDNSDQKVTQSGTQVVIGPLNDDFGDGNRTQLLVKQPQVILKS
jgi:hypothetical protein